RSKEARFDERSIEPTVAPDGPPPMPRSQASETSTIAPCPDDTWDNGILDDLPSPRYNHQAVWTGNLMLIWGGTAGKSGGRYDPVTDTWSPISTKDAPAPGATVVWTGNLMVAWGGAADSSGGR